MSPDRRIRLLRVGRRVYLAALAAAVVLAAAVKRADVAALLDGTRLPLLGAALGASFGLLGLGAGVWTLGLRMLGQPVPFSAVALATARALPARYVPVGVGFAIARAGFLRASGVGFGPTAAVAALEMALSAAVALAAGTALLGAVGAVPGGPALAAAVAAALVFCSSPAVSGRALAWIAARRGADLTITWPGWLRLLGAAGAYWAWASATFVLYLAAFPSADGLGAAKAAGAFMVSWAAGFLSVLAPQGIGVAETGLVALLASGESSAIAFGLVFAGYRLVLLARDAVAAGAGEVIAIRQARPRSQPTG